MSVLSRGDVLDNTEEQVAHRSWWWVWWWQQRPKIRRHDLPVVIRDGLLKAAVEAGDLHRLKQLIREGIYPHKMKDGGAKLLSISAIQNQLDIVRVLIENGCSVNQASRDGSTPLQYAAWNGHVSMVELLLEAGGVIQQRHGDSLAMIAAIHGHVHVLKLLILRGQSFTEVNSAGDTALHHACRHGHLHCVQLLCQQTDLDINARNVWGHTAIMVALLQRHEQLARWLTHHGCDVTLADIAGRTPIHLTSCHNMYDLTLLLIQHGASVNYQDNHHRTALTEATYFHNQEIIRLLLIHNADVNLRALYPDLADTHVTPFILALLQHHYSIARMLYEAGSQVSDLPSTLRGNVHLMAWLEQALQPRSLQSLCRLAIRRLLKHSSMTLEYQSQSVVMHLPLAPRLRRYISFEE